MIDTLINFWHRMVNYIQSMTAVMVIAGGLLAIVAIVFVSITKFKRVHTNVVIIFSTLFCCILTIPVISSFNHLVKIKVEGAMIDEGKAEIRAQRAEAERMRLENEAMFLLIETTVQQITIGRQTVEMQTLNDSIKLMEHTQFSMQSFQKILELALLETNLKQTMVRKDRIPGVQQDGRYNEVLAIITHDITAKYGIDLNEVKVAKLNENTVVVSGIRSKFIATSRNIAETFLSEIRRVDTRGSVDTVRVEKDSASLNLANQYADNFKAEFQRGLSNGTELGFMDDAVVQLAQNFIRVMLAPLYRNITFDNINRPDALPLMEHLERELRETNARILELEEENDNFVQSIEQLESEIEQIEDLIEESLIEESLLEEGE